VLDEAARLALARRDLERADAGDVVLRLDVQRHELRLRRPRGGRRRALPERRAQDLGRRLVEDDVVRVLLGRLETAEEAYVDDLRQPLRPRGVERPRRLPGDREV